MREADGETLKASLKDGKKLKELSLSSWELRRVTDGLMEGNGRVQKKLQNVSMHMCLKCE